jgi:predicted transport protein
VETNTHRIDLLSVRRHGQSTILLEWVHREEEVSKSSPPAPVPVSVSSPDESDFSEYEYWLQTVANVELHNLFMALHDYLLSLGDDVRANPTKYYIGFRRKQTMAFVRMRTRMSCLKVNVRADLENMLLQEGFTRDDQGSHYGSCNLEITICNQEDLEKAKPLLRRSYEKAG